MAQNRLVINMIATVVSLTTNFCIGFFLTPFVVSRLGIEAYGFFGLANEFLGYVQILTVALNSMASRFITVSFYQNKTDDVLKYFSSVLIANIILACVLLVPSLIFIANLDHFIQISSNLVSDVTLLWLLIFFSFFISIIGTPFGVATFAKNRLDLSSLRKVEACALRAVILVGAFFIFKSRVWYLGLAEIACSLYVFGINIYYTKKLLPEVKVSTRYHDFGYVKQLISSGVWNSFTRLGSLLSRGLDLLLVNIFISAEAMGYLSVSKTLPSQILSLFAVIAGVFAPQLTISYAQKDTQGMKNQVLSSIKILGVFSCIPMAILFAYGEQLYSLWMPGQNAKLLQELSILTCLAYVFSLPLEGVWNVFTVANKVKVSSLYLFANSVISIVALLITLQFCDTLEMKLYVVAGLSTILSIIRALTFLPMYGAHCLGLHILTFFPAIIKNFIAVLLTAGIAFAINISQWIHSWGTFALASAITAITAFAINFVILLNKEDKAKLLHKIGLKK